MPRLGRKNIRSGFIKTGSRTTRIVMGQNPDRPFRIRRRLVPKSALQKNPWWWVTHRRGLLRRRVGVDPLEMRAVPKEEVKGTLPERIVLKWLINAHFVNGVDFDFQCVAASHRVLTADMQWIEAGNLREGDKLVSFDENEPRRCFKVGTVTANRVEYADVMRVNLSDGSSILATPEHPWLVYCDLRQKAYPTKGSGLGWWRTDQLRPGLEVPKPFTVWSPDRSWEAGYLAGFFDGEGSLVQRPQQHQGYYTNLTAAQNKGDTLNTFLRSMEATDFDFSIYDYDGKYKRSYDDEARKAVGIRINGGMPEAMRFLGTIRPPRLLRKLDVNKLGGVGRGHKVTITSIETGLRTEIARLGVDTHTYIAEGFCMHNTSMDGGRLELGGIVVDFLFYTYKMIIQVQGPTHDQYARFRKDEEQRLALEAMGYRVYYLDMDLIYREATFDAEMRRIFNMGFAVWGGESFGPYEMREDEGNQELIEQVAAQVTRLYDTFAGAYVDIVGVRL